MDKFVTFEHGESISEVDLKKCHAEIIKTILNYTSDTTTAKGILQELRVEDYSILKPTD